MSGGPGTNSRYRTVVIPLGRAIAPAADLAAGPAVETTLAAALAPSAHASTQSAPRQRPSDARPGPPWLTPAAHVRAAQQAHAPQAHPRSPRPAGPRQRPKWRAPRAPPHPTPTPQGPTPTPRLPTPA